MNQTIPAVYLLVAALLVGLWFGLTREPQSGTAQLQSADTWEESGIPRGSTVDPHESGLPGAGVHGAKGARPSAVQIAAVRRAQGQGGYTIAEIHAQKEKLSEQVVRVHGMVVKSTEGVFDATYLHLQDGSAAPSTGANDLTVVTVATPQVGASVRVNGRVTLNHDVGFDEPYPLVLQDAQLEIVAQL